MWSVARGAARVVGSSSLRSGVASSWSGSARALARHTHPPKRKPSRRKLAEVVRRSTLRQQKAARAQERTSARKKFDQRIRSSPEQVFAAYASIKLDEKIESLVSNDGGLTDLLEKAAGKPITFETFFGVHALPETADTDSGDAKDLVLAFDRPYPLTVQACNKLLRLQAHVRDWDGIRHTITAMRAHEMQFDPLTFVALATAAAQQHDAAWAQTLLDEAEASGLASPSLYSAVANAHARAQDIGAALDVVNKVPTFQQNTIMYTPIIQAAAAMKDYERAWEIFDHARQHGIEPDAVTFSTMIHICGQTDHFERALNLHEEMEMLGVSATEVTYNSLLFACGQRGTPEALETAKTLFAQMQAAAVPQDGITYNTMISTCARCGDADAAISYATKMEEAQLAYDDFTYNALLTSPLYANDQLTKNRFIKEAELLFEEMQTEGIKPGLREFNALCLVYTRGNRIHRALGVLEQMQEAGVTPDFRTKSMIESMLVRTKQFHRIDFVNSMFQVAQLPDAKTRPSVRKDRSTM